MKILMPVFNPIDFDGRVQRAAETLSSIGSVTVVDVDSGRPFVPPGYALRRVPLPDWEGARWARHPRFWCDLAQIAAEVRPDLVYAHDFFLALPGLMLARALQAPLVYDAHEVIVPDPAQPHTRRERFFYLAERFVARRADLVISVTPDIARILQRCYGLSVPPLVIPNHSSAPSNVPPAEDVLRRYPDLASVPADAVRLIYVGDMDRRRGIADFIAAMPALPTSCWLLLVGDGPDFSEIRAQVAASPAAARIRCFGRIPRGDAFAMMKLSTIGILTVAGRILAFRFGSSNKVFEYAHAGLPLLATRQPSLARLIEPARIGVLLSTRDADAAARTREIAAALAHLLADLAGFRARLAPFIASHAWEHQARKLRDAVASVARLR